MLLIAESCAHIAEHPPQTYHQAVQLFWLYSMTSLAKNYGRLDITLGDILAEQLDSGAITYDQALEMTVGLWRLMLARGNNFNSRVIIGGIGRPNEKNADRFALLALDAQEIVNDIIPQLSLRCYKDMDPRLWERAIDVIAKGSSFPIIYNDDVNIPAVAKAMDIALQEAEQYFPYGCGEYIIEAASIGSPDAAFNVAKCLNATLRNGFVPVLNEYRGLKLGSLQDFETFEQLQTAFAKQIEYQLELLAEAQDNIYRITGRHAAYPYLSMLYADCLESGRPLLAGGVRYRGGTVETFGNITAGDSLLAIKELVFEQKRIAPEELLAALDADFVGYEHIRQMLKNVPKFGNDDPEVDQMALWLNEIVCRAAMKQKHKTNLDSFLVVIINNGDNVTLGKGTAATPDGRKATAPLSNGNQPTAGADTNGPTALLNSMAKLDAALHAGTTQAIKLSRRMFNENRPVLNALLKGYFANGGPQLMITVTDRDELEKALQNPEEYANLIVRVGGYSERFVLLPRDVQQDVLARTLY
jgi:pyruvate-formate lyase